MRQGTGRAGTGRPFLAVTAKRWSDIRDKHLAAADGPELVEAGRDRLLTQVRAHRLAEIRKRQG
jgi:hypothetical protein